MVENHTIHAIKTKETESLGREASTILLFFSTSQSCHSILFYKPLFHLVLLVALRPFHIQNVFVCTPLIH